MAYGTMALGYLIAGLMVGGLVGLGGFMLFGLGAGASLALFLGMANLTAALSMVWRACRR